MLYAAHALLNRLYHMRSTRGDDVVDSGDIGLWSMIRSTHHPMPHSSLVECLIV